MAIFFIKYRENFIFLLILKIDFGVNLTLCFERRNVALPCAKLTRDIKSNRGQPG